MSASGLGWIHEVLRVASLIHAKNPEHCLSSPVRAGIYRSCAQGAYLLGREGSHWKFRGSPVLLCTGAQGL